MRTFVSNQEVCIGGRENECVESLVKSWSKSEKYEVGYNIPAAIADPNGNLKINDKLKLVPGHCDPTCNLHDWYVGVRDGKVETIWPITARGLSY